MSTSTLPPLTTSPSTSTAQDQHQDTSTSTSHPNPATIDTTPLSPTLERKTSLEKKLRQRPEAEALRERHILLDSGGSVAPGLQARAVELERQRVGDCLRKGLANRPTAPELVERNILPDSKAAPALQGHQRELQRHLRADSLEKALQGRPEKDVLVREGILKGGIEEVVEEGGKDRGGEEVVPGRVELE